MKKHLLISVSALLLFLFQPLEKGFAQSVTLVGVPDEMVFEHQLPAQGPETNPAPQPFTVSLSNGGTLTNFSVSRSVTTPAGVNWLLVSVSSGTTSRTVTVSVNPRGLAPNDSGYIGSVRVSASGASARTALIVLRVFGDRKLKRDPALLQFQATAGGRAPVQGIVLQTIGQHPGPLIFTTSVTTETGGEWLAVLPSSGTAPIGINVFVNTTGLSVRSYRGAISFRSTNPASDPEPAVVILTVTAPTSSLLVSQSSLSFSQPTGGASVSQNLTISSSDADLSFNVSAAVSTPPGGTWLSVNRSTGTTPTAITVSANPAGLAVGNYSGSVTITSATAVNSPQTVPVNLAVIPPGGGGQLISQIADGPVPDGGRWKTIITLVNRDADPAGFTLRFWQSNGSPLTLPVSGIGRTPEIQGTIPVGGSRTIQTEGSSSSLLQGWAEVVTSKLIGGVAVFGQQVAGRPDFEAAVPIGPTAAGGLLLPFDNTAGFDTSLALVNRSATQSASISVTGRDENAGQIFVDSLSLAARGHTAVALRDRFPAAANRRGVAVFSAPGAEVAGLGLRFNPGGSFTSFPTLPIQDAVAASGRQSISQVADGPVPEGGRWKTVVILVNRDVDPAPFTLRFWQSNGTALTLPVEARGASAEIQGTIPATGSRTIQTLGSSTSLLQGWAELESTKVIGGVAVFGQQVAGRPDFEAAAPLVRTAAGGFLLPFDNTQGVVTAVALVNTNASQSFTASILFRDEGGGQIAADSITLPARGQVAFNLPDRFPALANQRGVAEFTSTGADLSGLGLRFNPGGAFTSLPTLTK